MAIRLSSLWIGFTLAAAGCAQAPVASTALPKRAPGRYVETLSSGGLRRSYVLRVPRAYDATKRLPLVILLHGWTATAAGEEVYTNMAAKAEREGFVLATPEGLGKPQGWNVGFIDLSGKHADDAAFVGRVLDQVSAEVGVDPDRVFVAGHSNGAMLAHLVGARFSDRIAAVGAVAGTTGLPNTNGAMTTIPDPAKPVSVMLIHGKQDAMVAYDRKSAALLVGVGAEDSARWWASRDGCVATPQRSVSSNGNVVTETFTRGRNGTEVTLVSIGNGPHDWPGGTLETGHESVTGVNATDLLWEFFVAHPKRG